MNDVFDCRCGHPIGAHRVKLWPYFTPRCEVCECKAYERKPV